MNRSVSGAAFCAGLVAVLWVGAGYAANPLALVMTALIAAFYLAGALELRRFQQATAGLSQALAALPDTLPAAPGNPQEASAGNPPAHWLASWLATLPAGLQTPVRLRVQGERAGLPGPAMTPYLVGLLVLLGMLGTFLGMVVTLKGAVLALESTTDLATIRAALAAPVKGLGLAFGTSVAGVAASAMLGLMSALCRRDRLLAGQQLDARIATSLRSFSLVHQRALTLQALQDQAVQVPALVGQLAEQVAGQLQAAMAQLTRQQQVLAAQLQAGQDRFHAGAQAAYTGLAASVDRSLKDSLAESARLASAAVQPVVAATMASIARDTSVLHAQLTDAARAQLDGAAAHVSSTVSGAAQAWADAAAQHQHSSAALAQDMRVALATLADRFSSQSATLLGSVELAHRGLQDTVASGDAQRQAAWAQSLRTLADSLHQQWQQAGADSLRQQQQICQTLEHTASTLQHQAEAQARHTIAEMAGLVQTAAQAPQAAAEMIGVLRQELSASLVRDNAVLDERTRLMATLQTLLGTLQQGATEQRAAIDTLVAASATQLQQAGARLDATLQQQSSSLVDAAAQVTSSAVDVASLGDAFGTAVQLFNTSNSAVLAQLQQIAAALAKSTARSDEQLAYYVAQAREIIDLSILSQQQMVEGLRQHAGPPRERAGALAGEPA